MYQESAVKRQAPQYHVLGSFIPPMPNAAWMNATCLSEAVELAWQMRSTGISKYRLAKLIGMPHQVVGGLVEGGRKDLPADRVTAFCWAVGNLVVKQWIDNQEERAQQILTRL